MRFKWTKKRRKRKEVKRLPRSAINAIMHKEWKYRGNLWKLCLLCLYSPFLFFLSVDTNCKNIFIDIVRDEWNGMNKFVFFIKWSKGMKICHCAFLLLNICFILHWIYSTLIWANNKELYNRRIYILKRSNTIDYELTFSGSDFRIIYEFI
jgi:hypothetical protein